MTSNFKKIASSAIILFLLLTCYSVCYSQQISRIVNYEAEYQRGDEIKKEYAFPENVDPDKHFQIVFTFELTPEQIEADIAGTMIFDQENGTIQIRGRDGNLQSKGGLSLKGVAKIAFVIEEIPFTSTNPVLIVATFIINQALPIDIEEEVVFFDAVAASASLYSNLVSELLPIGSLNIASDLTWDEPKPFSTLLLDDDVEVKGGIRKLVRAELTAVDVVQLIVAALTAIPPTVSKPLGTVIELGIGNAAISANLGFLSTATLSGESITVNGAKITRENQTIKAPGLDLSQNSYTVNSSYNEQFTYKIDFVATSDVTLEFNPLGIPIWSFEKVIGELPIVPIVPIKDVDLNFTSNQTSFPITQTSTVSTVQAPVPQGTIPQQVLTDGGSSKTVDVASYFSSDNNLSYSVSATPSSIVSASVSGSRVTIRPRAPGVATVTVTASDTTDTSLTAIQTITVVVRQSGAVIVRPNTDPTFTTPSSSTPSAKGFREDVSVIVHNLNAGSHLNVRTGAGTSYRDIGDRYNGNTGIITAGPRQANGYKWWKIEWDRGNLEGWSIEADLNDEQILFRRPPDLEISRFDVSASTVGTGEDIKLEVRIENNGPGKSAATKVYFYYHSGSKNYDLDDLSKETDLRIPGAGKLSVPSLQERGRITLPLTVDAPAATGRYYYGAFLPSNVHDTDYQDDLTESMLNNNLASEERVEVISPDYIVESISVSKTTFAPGESFTLRATVRNQGRGEPTRSSILRYYRSSDARISTSDTRVGSDSVGELDTNETGGESISLTAPSAPGVYYYGACVSNVTNESNTNNNCSAAVAITVQASAPAEPAVPDLVVETPTTSTTTLGPGENFTLNATVRNKSTANSAATTFRWYHSPNATISVHDTEIGGANVSSLSAGGTNTQQLNLTAPLAAGTYYYGGCVESVTDESNTTNNCSSAITITVQNQAPRPIGSIPGQTLSVGDTPMRLDVSTYFSDPNNTSLTYTASSSDTSVVDAEAAGVSGSNLTIHPISDGSATITVTASDGELTATQTFSVTVNPIPNTISESPDLVVSLSASNNLVDANEYFKLIADVRNQGQVDAPDDTTVRYYFSTDSTISPDDEEFDTDRIWHRQLDVGESQDESTGLRAPEKPGDYYYYASVDSVEGEGNTDNNYSDVIKVSVRGPDLVIDSVSVDYYSGSRATAVQPNGTFRLHATIRNQGTDESTSTTLRYFVSSDATLSDDDTEFNTDRVHALDPSETEDEQSNTTLVNYVSGVFYCFVCIDDVEGEIDTDNNCSVPIQIRVRNVAPLAKGTIAAQMLNVGIPMSIDVSQYFTDSNKDTLTYSVSSSDNNVATATATQSQVTITPKRVGTATITVTANDGEFSATQTISVTVVEPNSAPAAIGTISSRILTAGGSAVQIDVSVNFQDSDGDNLTYTASSNNNNIATVNATDSQITITPVSAGSATITVTASDGKLTAMQTLSVSVVQPNRAPVAVGTISARTLTVGDSPLQIDVSSNFQDPDNNKLTYSANSNAAEVATAKVEGTQVIIAPEKAGNAIITVTASDGELTATQTISVNVSAAPIANHAPITVGGISSQSLTVGDSAIVIDVSSNFNDPDNDILTYSASSNNTSVATVSASGSQVTITPVDAGSTTITVTASDGTLTATQTISVIVNAAPIANRAPVTVGTISARTLTVGDSPLIIVVSGNFQDPDGNRLSYSASSNNTSVATVSASGSQITITPVNAGSATITVTASDGTLTATQNISVTVTDSQVPDTNPVPAPQEQDTDVSEESWMPDANLREEVRAALGLSDSEALTQQAMTQLRRLHASWSQITNLTGLEHATNLIILELYNNSIGDISPLQNLTALTNLNLWNNSISDITPLQKLKSLTSLDIRNNSISDITPLQNLTALTGLHLGDNPINNIRALSNLRSLTTLGLRRSSISDISILSNLTVLTGLVLADNQISDITPLQNLTALTGLFLNHNRISNISTLSNLTALSILQLRGNQISDITPLEALTELTQLELSGNLITDSAALHRLKDKNPGLSIDINPPVAVGTIPAQTLTLGGTAKPVDVAQYFNDPDDTALVYTVSSDDTTVVTAAVTGNRVTITPQGIGSATITVSASDGEFTATQTFSVSVTSPRVTNRAPIAVSTISSQTLSVGGVSVTVEVSVNFRDPDGDSLTYSASSDNTNVANANVVSDSQVTITPVATGNVIITVTASDGALTTTQTISVSVAPTLDEESWMPDANLRAVVRVALRLSEDETLTQQAMTQLTSLGSNDNQIESIVGLEYATNLTILDLPSQKISDITPLANLTSIEHLKFYGNQVSDLTPLANLTNLYHIDFRNNQHISDINSLQNLTTLRLIELGGNQISDLTPIENLSGLTRLRMPDNQISDLTPVENLTALTTLNLSRNQQISDLSPLEDLTSLTTLAISGCKISDITPLQDLTQLTDILLHSNQISDITLFGNLTAPWRLRLDNNQIRDVSAVENLTTLRYLHLAGNPISDYAPLRRLLAKAQAISIDITIPEAPTSNNAPVAVGKISAQTLTVGGASAQVDVSTNFNDSDDDTLTYTASSSNTGIATVSVTGSQVTITPVAEGSATITVTASDGKLTANQTISVTVNAALAEETWMPDVNLRAKVRAALALQEGEALTQQAMKGLTTLSAQSSSISDISGLEYATQLTELNLYDNSISDISALSGLTSLTNLDLGYTHISDKSALSGLTSLTYLGLAGNSISDLSALSGLTNLIKLDLWSNSISDISTLSGLTSLTTLYLVGNSISDISALSGLTNLTSLHLAYNSISDISALSGLTSLTLLRLDYNSISDVSALLGLTSLTELLLNHNSISDISAVSGLTNLTLLRLNNNFISDVSALLGLTSLTKLYLSGNSISDISAVSGLTNLTTLYLEWNSISDISALSKLTSLSVLYLHNNSISDISALSKLTSLTWLNLEWNSISDISALSKLTSLTTLWLDNNSISDVSALEDLTSLTTLLISGNQITDYGPLRRLQAKTTQEISIDIDITQNPSNAPSAQASTVKTALLPNYPNPFNPETWIPYQLAKPENVTLTIYDVRGVVIRQLALGHKPVGVYYSRSRAAHWDGKNNLGEQVAAGVYFVKFSAGDYTATRKMLILK